MKIKIGGPEKPMKKREILLRLHSDMHEALIKLDTICEIIEEIQDRFEGTKGGAKAFPLESRDNVPSE